MDNIVSQLREDLPQNALTPPGTDLSMWAEAGPACPVALPLAPRNKGTRAMSQNTAIAIVTATALASLGVGCAKEPKTDKNSPVAKAAKKNKPQAGATMSAEVLLRARASLNYYEGIRTALAADNLDPVAKQAESLANVAKIAAGKAKGGAKQSLDGMAKAALELKGKEDIEEARLAFGELSKHVVGLIAKEPELQRDHHVFECPMAKGYKKWVQNKEAMANPYMGKKMLQCGSKTKWAS